MCIPVKRGGGIYSILVAVPSLGDNDSVTKDGREATTWPAGHVCWPNRLYNVGAPFAGS
jgi:hypothetical protein